MRQVKWLILIAATAGFYGCGSGLNRTEDHQFHDTGELRLLGQGYSYVYGVWPFEPKREYLFGYGSEYFKNGRLKGIVWSAGRNPQIKLEFYENGRMKSEELFDKGEQFFGVYYAEDGTLEKTLGERLMPVSRK
jgi:hypothetical protein